MYTLATVTTPAELGAAATPADMAAWNMMVAEHPKAGQEITEAEWLTLLDQIAFVGEGATHLDGSARG